VHLFDFQQDLKDGVFTAWDEGAQNVMAVAPTGSGKTVVMSSTAQDVDAPTCAIAHRQELVSQIALAFNRDEIPHGIIAPPPVVREIIAAEMELHGRSFYNKAAPVRAAGVDSLRTYDKTDRWLSQVELVIQDEAHHVLRENKWGRAMGMFPKARGLFLTAHALRADGAGLGRHADGLVDRLVVGPSCRTLIDRGFLTDYTLYCPPSDLDLSHVDVGSTGEFVQEQLAEAVHNSNSIVGDVVKHYKEAAEGELGITFAVDVKDCHRIADAYNAAGIPAAVITAKTPITQRAKMMRDFRARKILQLVSKDVLGEGTDVPACTVVSMARPTASFQLCAQQFGRMLRVFLDKTMMSGWHTFSDEQRLAYIAQSTKPRGILIDHVGNTAIEGGLGRHGLPDRPRAYTLDRREGRSKQRDDTIPLRVCANPNCKPRPYQPYEAFLTACPRCKTPKPAPKARSTPEQVDGDLVELDPETLRQLRGEIERIDAPPRISHSSTPAVAGAIKRNHWERQQQQATLRDAIATWAGWQTHLGRGDRESYRRFFHTYRIDVATAQTLGAKEAAELEGRIRSTLAANNVVKQT
jgi:DNA repair protein RadD